MWLIELTWGGGLVKEQGRSSVNWARSHPQPEGGERKIKQGFIKPLIHHICPPEEEDGVAALQKYSLAMTPQKTRGEINTTNSTSSKRPPQATCFF